MSSKCYDAKMDESKTEGVFIWKLQTVMDTRKITRYALQKASGVPMNTLRPIYDSKTARADFKVLGRLLVSLRVMTGEDLRLGDLLEWQPNN